MRVLPRLGRRSDDSGAVTALVCVLLGCGVLLGTGALVVDIGQLYVEREELQSGADAAAMATARNCAVDPSHCTPVTQAGPATTYADANAMDGHSAVAELCGTALATPCAAQDPTRLSSCIGPVPTEPYVQVTTETETRSGSHLLPGTFVRLLLGNEKYDGTTVRACARALPRTAGCVNADVAKYTHEFDGRAGTAKITAVRSLCAGQTQVFTLISYTAPSPTFNLPQDAYKYESFTIDSTHPTHDFKVEIPTCYTQVDFVFGGPHLQLRTTDDLYGDAKVGVTDQSTGVPGKVVNTNGFDDGAWVTFDNGGPCCPH